MPRATSDFSPIDAGETGNFTFSFVPQTGASWLGSGEVITGVVSWTLASKLNIDRTPSTRLIGSPVFTTTTTTQAIGNCIAGEIYLVTATVLTSANQQLLLYCDLRCKSALT